MNFIYETNKIYAKNEDGKIIAEVDFPLVDEQTVEIMHTFVDDSLRGQGVAAKLMQAAADTVRKQGKKARLTCSYAVKWFEKNSEQQDLIQ